MKKNKIKYLFVLVLLFFVCIDYVHAERCPTITENKIVTFFAGDYGSVPYCKNGTLQGRGCYPLTIASILASYGNNVTPNEVSSYLCTYHEHDASTAQYSGIMVNQAFQNHFSMKIEAINHTIEAIDAELNANKMVLASVTSRSIFTKNTHYIAIAKKISDNEYYIINTGSKGENTSGRYTKEQVIQNVVNSLNMGMWSVTPTNCTNNIQTNPGSSGGSSSGNTSGRTEDDYENYFPSLEENEKNKCEGTFLNRDGSLNQLGEFVEGLFLIIKIAVPIIVIILTTIEYVKAIASQKDDDVKKATGHTVTRLIIGLILFFLPYILELLFYLFGLYDLSTCGIGV